MRPVSHDSALRTAQHPPRSGPPPQSGLNRGQALGRAALFVLVLTAAALLAWKLGAFELQDRAERETVAVAVSRANDCFY